VHRSITIDINEGGSQSKHLKAIVSYYVSNKVRSLDGGGALDPKCIIQAGLLARWLAAEAASDPREESCRAAAALTYGGCFSLGEIVAAARAAPNRGLRRGHVQLHDYSYG